MEQSLPEKISLFCKQRDISVHKLEKLVGIAENSIRNWDKSTPSGDRIQKVADFFDISIDFLMNRTDNPKSHKSTLECIVPAVTQINVTVDKLKTELNQILTDYHLNPIPYNPSDRNT